MKKLILLLLLSTMAYAEPPWYVRVDFGGSPFTSRGYSAGGVTINISDVSIGGTLIVDGMATFGTSIGIGGTPPGTTGIYAAFGPIVLRYNEFYAVNVYYDGGFKFAKNGPYYGGFLQYLQAGGGRISTTTNSGNTGDAANVISVISWTAPGVVTIPNDLFVNGGDFAVGSAGAGNIGTTDKYDHIQFLTTTTARLKGAWDIGDGTNNLVIATDGFTTLTGTARAVMEMQHNALELLGPGPGNPPAGPNLTGHTFTLDFSPTTDEEVFTIMEIPHNWAIGTDVRVNFHWAPIDNGPGTVTWGVETKIITPESGTLTEASVATQIVTDDTSGTTQDEFLESGLIIIDLSGAAIGDFLALRIFRDADASEGDADDDYGSDAQLAAFHMEFIVDSFGTDEAW